MIARIEPTSRKRAVLRYHLRVALTGTEPPVWRLLQVPGTAKLDWLHAVLQVAIGWTNSHLHRFEANGIAYSDTRYHFAEFEGDPEILEESKVTLSKVAPGQRRRSASMGPGLVRRRTAVASGAMRICSRFSRTPNTQSTKR